MVARGTFVTQNKKLGGTYHNFISQRRSFLNLSERGFVALPMALSWGASTAMTITAEAFQRDTLSLLGYAYDSEEMKPLREIFRNSHTVYLQALKGTDAVAAENTFATARYTGLRGNALQIVIRANVDNPTAFDVQTLLDGRVVEEQVNVASSATLVDNAWVVFKKDSVLAVNAGLALTGGTDGTVDIAVHQAALEELEQFNFNVLICDSNEVTIKSLYEAYTKRLRTDVGLKFQLVAQGLNAPDHEGVIDLFNEAVEGHTKLTYWVGGASAGVAVNASNENKLYDGEYTVNFDGAKTKAQLIALLDSGKYVIQKSDSEARVLADINSFTNFTPEKNEDFSLNQVIRVLDQIAVDTANIFNARYLGKVPNDADGRLSLWGDIVAHRSELQRLRAIQNYDPKELTVGPGVQKNGVVASEVIETSVAMSKLYITTVVA